MANVTVIRVLDLGHDDLILIEGEVDGTEVTATGWASALTNHYPASAYDKNGDLRLKDKHPDGNVREGVVSRMAGGKAVLDKDAATGRGLGDPVARSRKMTKAEKLAYCKARLLEQNPQAIKPRTLRLKG